MIPIQENSEFKREPMVEGWYPAILRQVIYIGKQHFSKEKKNKETGKMEKSEWLSPQVVIGFELPTVKFESREGQEFTKLMSMTLFTSLSPSYKGIGLYEIATALDVSTEADSFDETELVGKPCEVRIASVMSKGKAYDNIVEIRATNEAVEGNKENIHFDMNDIGDEILMAQLPEWIQNRIMMSEEYRGRREKEKEVEDGIPMEEVEIKEDVTDQLSQVNF